MNSKQDIDTDGTFEVKVGTLRKDEGGGGGPASIINTDMASNLCSLKTKTSLVFIPAIKGENICAAHAIVTCLP